MVKETSTEDREMPCQKFTQGIHDLSDGLRSGVSANLGLLCLRARFLDR